MPVTFDLAAHVVAADGQTVQLTPIQATIYAAVIRRHGHPATHSALVDEVWPDGDGAEETVKVHVHKLRRRLEQIGAERTIINVWGVGYRAEGVEMAGAVPLALTPAQIIDLKRLINTHPDANLCARVLAAIGCA
jgi:DNA-binding response OmpR family regulator